MSNPLLNRRVLFTLALAAGVVVLAFWSRSSPRPSAQEKLHRSVPIAAVSNPPAKRMAKATSAKMETQAPRKAKTSEPASWQDKLDQAFQIQDPIGRSMQFGRDFAEWYPQDPVAAIAYLRKMPRGGEFTSSLFMILSDIGKKDPKRALSLAAELATNSEQRVVYNVLFDLFAEPQAEDAVPLLALVPEGEARINAVRALTIRWADQGIEYALAWAQGLENPEDRATAIESVLFELSEHEPWRAFAVAAQNLDGDALERTVGLIFKQLKTIDPEKAVEFVRWLPSGETQTHIVLNLARAMAEREPASALEWSNALPSEEQRELALRNVLDVWLVDSPGEASEYVAQMPKGIAQDAAAAHLAEQLAVADADVATAFVRGLKSASARQAASVGLASGWARQDPAAATRWAAGLERNATRADAMDAALSYWVLSDSAAAVRYVRKLEVGNSRDDGLDALSELLSVQQSALAVELAAAIESPELRGAALATAYSEWLSHDSASARKWLAGSDLSTEVRRKLLGN